MKIGGFSFAVLLRGSQVGSAIARLCSHLRMTAPQQKSPGRTGAFEIVTMKNDQRE
jgi:hypothetical protein